MLITGINWGHSEAGGRHLLEHYAIWCVWKKKSKGLLLSEATHICSVHLKLSSVCLSVCVCVCVCTHLLTQLPMAPHKYLHSPVS